MKFNKKYLITLSIIAVLLFSLYSTANPWIWLTVVVISGLLPVRIDRKGKWTFLHYFACAVAAMGIFYLVSPPDPEIVDAMGELFPLHRSGYLAAVGLVSAGFYGFLSLTVAVIAKALFPCPGTWQEQISHKGSKAQRFTQSPRRRRKAR